MPARESIGSGFARADCWCDRRAERQVGAPVGAGRWRTRRGVCADAYGYEPDIDPERREPVLRLQLSDSSELPLRLRWLATLSSTVKASLALTGGVNEPIDAVKAVMAGADGVQLVSALFRHGPGRLTLVRQEFERWAEAHHYESLRQMRGCANIARSPTPEQFGRGNYVRALQSGPWPAASGTGQ